MATERLPNPPGPTTMFTAPQQPVWRTHHKPDVTWKFTPCSWYLMGRLTVLFGEQQKILNCLGGVNNPVKTFFHSYSLPILHAKENVRLELWKTKWWKRQGNWGGRISTWACRVASRAQGAETLRQQGADICDWSPSISLRSRARIWGLRDGLGCSWHLQRKQ